MKHLYSPAVVSELYTRIQKLSPVSTPLWGSMNAAQMLAHCALAMDNALGVTKLPRHPLGRIIGGVVKRSMLVKGKPMGHNAPSHPTVTVVDERDFDAERTRLLESIEGFAASPQACTTHPHFFFGPMTPAEWSQFMYIHLDHHLRQFQV